MNSDCELIDHTYKNTKTKLSIKCGCGNVFKTTFEKFKIRNKRQCNTCSGITNWDIDSVAKYINSKDGNGCKLMSHHYKNMYTKLSVMCKCGDVYETSFTDFKNANAKQCPSCGKNKSIDSRRLKYKDVKNIIEDNGCKLLSDSYTSNSIPLEIMCECKKIYKVTFANFIYQNQSKCGFCRGKVHWNYNLVKEYVNNNTDCNLISKSFQNADSQIKFQCKCGNIFFTSFSCFKNSNKTRCDKCSNSMSRSEYMISEFLIRNNVSFIQEYRFEDCRNKLPLPFDFAIIDDYGNVSILIESDGEGHYKPINFGGTSDEVAISKYKKLKINENIKNKYCEENGINLLRIPYWDFERIEEVLSSVLP